jgi:hypothetical protein
MESTGVHAKKMDASSISVNMEEELDIKETQKQDIIYS